MIQLNDKVSTSFSLSPDIDKGKVISNTYVWMKTMDKYDYDNIGFYHFTILYICYKFITYK